MTQELKNLYDQKGKTWAQMNDVARKLKEGKELSAEENTQFESWDGELRSITDKIKKIERAQELEAEMAAKNLESQAGNGGERTELSDLKPHERTAIYKRGLHLGVSALNEKERAVYQAMEKENTAFVKVILGGELNDEERNIATQLAKRAQSTSASAGGYTIPQGFLPRIDAKLKYISPFFAEGLLGLTNEAETIFDVLRTEQGNDIHFSTNDDTGTTGELLGENTDAFANAADLTFSNVILKAYKYSSKPFKVSNELLNDTGVDLMNYIAGVLATRIARIANTHFTTGDDTNKPQGAVTGATAGKTTAASAAITFPEVLDLIHSVDPAYRKSPSARFMFHDNILLYLKKLTISSSTNDSRPLWQPGYALGAPDTIDGYQYLINQDMASALATTNITMLFGDMKKYMVRTVNNYVVKRLDERFADLDQTAWLMFARLDGRYANTAAIKKMTQV